MAIDEPGGDGTIEFRKVASKEMIGVVDQRKTIFSWEFCDQFLDFGAGAEFVVCAVNK